MIKKLSVLTSLLFISTNVLADFMPAAYVGGGLGIVTNADSHFGLYRGVPLRIFAGYGGIINTRLYLAGEVGGTLATGELVNNSLGLKSSTGYMVSVIPGLMLNNETLGYVRLAGVRTQFKDPNESISGAQIGFGLNTSIMPNVFVRGEYSITCYQDLHRMGQKRSPRTDGGNIDLIYKFG